MSADTSESIRLGPVYLRILPAAPVVVALALAVALLAVPVDHAEEDASLAVPDRSATANDSEGDPD